MPTISYELTLLLEAIDDGTTLGEALFFPEASAIAVTKSRVRDQLAAAARRTLEELPGGELARRTRAGTPELAQVELTVSPPRRSASWVEPVQVSLPYAHWTHGTDAAVAVVPALGIQVLAERAELLPELVQREVQLALSRTGAAASLHELAFVTRARSLSVETASVQATIPTPLELLVKEADEDHDPALPQVATDLVALGPRGAQEVEEPLARLAELLSAARPRSVLLVGRSGVGKTALFGELVRRRATLGLAHTPFWATSGARLVAGMTGFGMWQERCVKVIREVSHQRAVLHVGNLQELVEVGRSNRNAQGIASFLKPFLARGELAAVAECTPEQLAVLERADPHLSTVWCLLNLEEPVPRAARVILEAAVARGVRHGRPPVDARGLDMLERLHRRYATYSAWPGRPLRFLEGLVTGRPSAAGVGEREVVEAFSHETGLPRMMLDDACVMDVESTRHFFATRVMGQVTAVDLVTSMLATVKARLTRPRRPIASLLFIGPTGVGKTETARALAQFLFGDPARMTRFDMSEFSDPLAAQRLVGITGRSEGLLTARVREQPFSVVLLDEFEKADGSFLDLLLQILGDGRLTDAAGRVADFSSAVVILTSNLGAESFARGGAGFATGDDPDRRAESHFVEAVRASVRPELFNRIDRVVPFLPLSREVVRGLVKRELDIALRRDGLLFRRAHVEVQPAALELLAERGFDPRYGARPLKRALEREVLAPLAAGLVRHPEGTPVRVAVGLAEGRLAVEVRAAEADDESVRPDAESEEVAAAQQLRRELQRLERGRAMTQLTNELYMLTRAHDKQLKRGKKKGAVKQGGRGRRRQENERYDAARARRLAQLRVAQKQVASLRERAVSAEDAALLAVYRDLDLPGAAGGATAAPGAPRTRAEAADAMRAALVMMRALTHASPDAVSLLLIGDDPGAQFRLAGAYAGLAHALSYDLEVDAVSLSGSALVAARVPVPYVFVQEPRAGVIALMMTVRGPAAGLRFETEVGVHRFREKDGREVGVEVRLAELPFTPPPGIERRGIVPASGARRRFYDQVRGTIEDHVAPGAHAWTAAWFRELTQRAMDRALEDLLTP